MISIIITTYQEPETLKKAIGAILNQKLTDQFELLVVGPDQATENVTKIFQAKNPNVFYLKDEHLGKPAALNLAIKQAHGDILVLTDGDVWIDNQALMPLLLPFNQPSVGATTGQPIPINSKKNLFGYWAHFLTNAAHQMRLISKNFPCSGYLYAFRKNLINFIPENTLSEDGLITQMIREKNYQIIYTPEARVLVKYPNNFHDWIMQKKRSTGGYKQKTIFSMKKERNFSGEVMGGIKLFFTYPKNPKEFWWTKLLYLARLYLWLIIFWERKIKHLNFHKTWQRIESTK